MCHLALNKRKVIEPQKGYSLIEMVVVIFIIVILFGLGIANYRDYSRRRALHNLVQEIKSDFRLAQEYALSGRKPATCDVLRGFAIHRTGAEAYRFEAVCSNGYHNVGDSKSLPTDFIIFISSPTPNRVVFRVLGRGVDTGVDIRVRVRDTIENVNKDFYVSSSGEIYDGP